MGSEMDPSLYAGGEFLFFSLRSSLKGDAAPTNKPVRRSINGAHSPSEWCASTLYVTLHLARLGVGVKLLLYDLEVLSRYSRPQ